MSRGLRLALLGIWAGLLVGFGAVAIPAAFTTLPGTELSARLVGVVLTQLDQLGIAISGICVCLGLLDRPVRSRARALFPGIGGLLHVASLVWVAPRIHAIREGAGGSIGKLSPGSPDLELFSQLHNGSVALFVAAGLVALAAIAWDLASTRRNNQASP